MSLQASRTTPYQRPCPGRRCTGEEILHSPVFRMLALLAAAMLAASTALAATVPFGGVQTVNGSFDDPRSVFSVDVDGDGDVDVLGASFGDDDITWWENTAGDGSVWFEHQIDSDFDGAASVFAVDVDGDGDIDVLGAAERDHLIVWWENDGTACAPDCAWPEHTIGAAFEGATSVFAADVDGDGDTDVLGAALNDDDITWWDNTAGDGSAWAPHTIDTNFDGANTVVAADVDGDGHMDVLGSAQNDGDIVWWENDDTPADGGWSKHTIDSTFPGANAVFAADVDGDGDTDVLGTGGSDTTWWENDGTPTDGGWIERTIDSNSDAAAGVFATDFDGDGDVDVLASAKNDDDVFWWENDGTPANGGWTEHLIDGSPNGPNSVFATDLDGDGDKDVLGTAGVDGDILWWENKTIHRSAVYPTEHTIDSTFVDARFVHAADVNGDGHIDVLGAAFASNDFSWWKNDGTPTNGGWTKVTIGSFFHPTSVFTADIDGDGDTDVVGSDQTGTKWFENDGTPEDGGWDGHLIASWTSDPGAIPADVDGDGDTDIVIGVSFGANRVVWIENLAGDGSSWSSHFINKNFVGAKWVDAADVDGDGDTDILGAATTDGMAWFENPGWAEHTIDDENVGGSKAVIGIDLDGDGDTDVLGGIGAFGIFWWENDDGIGSSWIRHTVDGSFSGVDPVFATDVDGDGDPDVMGAAGVGEYITWWENVAGDASAWTAHTIEGTLDGARSVFAIDLDRDGDTDMLGAGVNPDDVTWWENKGGQFALPTEDVATARVSDGATESALVIDFSHRGRPGDADVELATFELLLTDAESTPLTDTDANDLLAELSVYLDNGSGVFESGSDTKVTSVTSFSLTAGVLTLAFADNDSNTQVPFAAQERYFIVVEFESDASQQAPDELQITHITEASSTGEDADNDLPISLEFSTNVTSTTIEVNDLPVAAADQFTAMLNTALLGNVFSDNGSGADSDEESDGLTATIVTLPGVGSLTGGLDPDGSFTYQPAPDTIGEDTFTYSISDGYGNSNVATVTITVVTQIFTESDLGITKDDGVTHVIPGTMVTYTIIATNSGPDDAAAVNIVDSLPSNATWDCSGSSDGACGASSGTAAIDELVDLPVGGSVTYTASHIVDPFEEEPLENTALVNPAVGTIDLNAGNDSATDSDGLTPQADIAVTISNGVDELVAGEEVTYTIVVTNIAGPSGAEVLVNSLISGFINDISWTCSGDGGGDCTASGSGDISESVNLAAAAKVTYVLTGTLDPDIGHPSQMMSTVMANPMPPLNDSNTINNTASDSDPIVLIADLAISKSDGLDSAISGDQVTYTIIVSNDGPSSAHGVDVDDVFPSGLTDVSWVCIESGEASCSAAGNGDIDDGIILPVGDQVEYTVTATFSPGPLDLSVVNTATVTFNETSEVTDTNLDNNSATDETLSELILMDGFED